MTVVASPAVPVADGERSTSAAQAAWRRLAWAETARALQHPAFSGAVGVVLFLWGYQALFRPASLEFSVLHDLSREVQPAMLIPAAGMFLAANLIALRSVRFGTDELYLTLAMPAWHRRAAQLVAPIGPALLCLLVVVVEIGYVATLPGAVGRPVVAEILAVPAVVWLAGVTGVLGGQVFRSAVAGGVALAGAGAIAIVGVIGTVSPWRWLAPFAGENPFESMVVSRQLLTRPAAWHLGWLIAFGGVVVVWSLWDAGLRRGPALVAAVPLLAAAAITGSMQTRPISPEQHERVAAAISAPAALQSCRSNGGVTYCAFDDFEPWIEAWSRIVDGERALVPDAVAAEPRFVRQRLGLPLAADGVPATLPVDSWAADDVAAATPDPVPVSTLWAAGGSDDFGETEVVSFAVLFAADLVGVSEAADPTALQSLCGAPGALVYWLAAASAPEVEAALATVTAHGQQVGLSVSVVQSSSGLGIGPRERLLGEMMLTAEREMMVGRVQEAWSVLTDPTTSVDDGAAALGLSGRPPAGFEDFICS